MGGLAALGRCVSYGGFTCASQIEKRGGRTQHLSKGGGQGLLLLASQQVHNIPQVLLLTYTSTQTQSEADFGFCVRLHVTDVLTEAK